MALSLLQRLKNLEDQLLPSRIILSMEDGRSIEIIGGKNLINILSDIIEKGVSETKEKFKILSIIESSVSADSEGYMIDLIRVLSMGPKTATKKILGINE